MCVCRSDSDSEMETRLKEAAVFIEDLLPSSAQDGQITEIAAKENKKRRKKKQKQESCADAHGRSEQDVHVKVKRKKKRRDGITKEEATN